jgi:ribosome-associated translation inhibitor RaiA
MTIHINVIDVIEILLYLSKETPYFQDIEDCYLYSKDLIPKRSSEPETTIYKILETVLFMLIYIVKNIGTSNCSFESKYGKNVFEFLFRVSLSDIIVGLFYKYDCEIVSICLNKLKKKLFQNNISISKKISDLLKKSLKMKKDKDVEEEIEISFINKEIEKFNDIFNSYNAFIKYIDFINTNINKFKEKIDEETGEIIQVSFEDLEKSNIINQELSKEYFSNKLKKTDNENLPEDERKSEEILEKELECESNIFFTNFIENTQYFNYEYLNETMLIEFRCFAQKLLLETKTGDTNIYKNLSEWNKIIKKI